MDCTEQTTSTLDRSPTWTRQAETSLQSFSAATCPPPVASPTTSYCILYCGPLAKGSTSLMRCNVLKELGHQVAPFDFSGYEGGGSHLYYRLRLRFYAGPSINRLNRSLLKAVQETKPDIVWVDKGRFIRPQTLQTIKDTTGSFLVNYNNDDPFGNVRIGWRLFRQAIPIYSLICTPRNCSVDEYKAHGARAVLRYGWGFSPMFTIRER